MEPGEEESPFGRVWITRERPLADVEGLQETPAPAELAAERQVRPGVSPRSELSLELFDVGRQRHVSPRGPGWNNALRDGPPAFGWMPAGPDPVTPFCSPSWGQCLSRKPESWAACRTDASSCFPPQGEARKTGVMFRPKSDQGAKDQAEEGAEDTLLLGALEGFGGLVEGTLRVLV